MSTVKVKNKIIKYANGKKMVRCGFDVEKSIGERFKRQLLKEGRTMASVLRPTIDKFLEHERVDV